MGKLKLLTRLILFLEIPTYLMIIPSIILSFSIPRNINLFLQKKSFVIKYSLVDSVEIKYGNHQNQWELYYSKIDNVEHLIIDNNKSTIKLENYYKSKKKLKLIYSPNYDNVYFYSNNFWEEAAIDTSVSIFIILIPFLLLLLIIYSKRQLKILAPHGVDDNYQPLKNPKDESV